MARREERQPRTLSPGDPAGGGPDGERPSAGKPRPRSWEEVARELGRLLREARFEAYLADGESPEPEGEG